jgi:tryptophan-rich sensory protein
MKNLLPKIILCVLLCVGLGVASGFSTIDSIGGWYQTIQKPSWNPPNWLFGPVWTLLYIMMGISVALVWHGRHNAKKSAMMLFVVQLMLNLLWSYIFFGKQNIFLAFIEIIIMWIFILLTIIYFYRINKTSAYLLIPYLLWVSFAAFLNYYIYVLNR